MQAMVHKTTSSDSNDSQIGARATLQSGIERIYSGLPKGRGWATYLFNTLTLGSHFQPIFCASARRCIGYEGLLRAANLAGQAMKPETVFAVSANQQEELFLDWLCRGLHLRNFNNLAAEGDLVFLNAYPEAAIEDPHHPQAFARLIEFYGVNPCNVVVEILETGVSDEALLADAARLYRSLGCQIAIDDFGVGYSNFDRLWRLRPDFVKIDRSVTVSAVRDPHARRVLANMVNLIQQCGAKVIVEGIETRDEALAALEVGADFLQGFYFARPGQVSVPQELCDNMFAGLVGDGRPVSAPRLSTAGFDIETYAHALNVAVLDLQRGAGFARATEIFRALPQVLRICLVTVDDETDLLAGSGAAGARLVLDLIENAPAVAAKSAEGGGAALDRLRQVLKQALRAPRQVHISADTPPAEPLAGQNRGAVTLSCAFELEQRMVVLCGDLTDRRSPGRSAVHDSEPRQVARNVIHLHR